MGGQGGGGFGGDYPESDGLDAFTAVTDEPIRLTGVKKARLDSGRQRLALLIVAFTLCFAVLAVRLGQLALFGHDDEKQLAAHDRVGVERVDITDRNGQLLATDLRVASVYANPKEIWDVDEAVAKLRLALPHLDAGVLKTRLASDKQFVWIKRDLSPKEQEDVHNLGLPGINFQLEERRFYLQNRTVSHALGYVDTENHGLAGLERALDKRLVKPDEGPLALSIDLRVQHAMRDELQKAMASFSCMGAAGLVMDVETGELLAMVSLPDFDSNEPGTATPDERFNRTTLGVYEMGSTFKTFTVAMALDSGKVTLQSGYDATKPIRIGGYVIADYHAENRWLTVPEIFLHSSNIGSAKMALDVGVSAHRAFLAKLGLLSKPKVEVSEIGAPLVPAPWHEINTMTIAFGHGMAVSPVQLARAAGPIANGGWLVEPTLLKRVGPVPRERVVSERTSKALRELLREVVTEGTGKLANAKGYDIGGKTGTAEKVASGGYKKNALLSSFLAIFPAQAPRYLVIVILDEPHGIKETYGFATAGWTAAPTAARVIERAAPILRVSPLWENDSTQVAAKG